MAYSCSRYSLQLQPHAMAQRYSPMLRPTATAAAPPTLFYAPLPRPTCIAASLLLLDRCPWWPELGGLCCCCCCE